MYIVQGFLRIPQISNNNNGVTAPFGELSPTSWTFSRSIKNYANGAKAPSTEFVAFKSVDETNQNIDVPAFIAETVLKIGQWVYTQSTKSLIPSNQQISSFIQALTDEFSNLTNTYGLPAAITKTQVGEILDTPVAGQRMPDYIAFELKDDKKVYDVKFWFSDKRFALQYPYYEMVVLPPVGYVDALNGTTADVSNLLNSITKTQIVNQITAVTRDYPATYIYSINLRWHNPNNPTSTLDTEWFVVVYGQAGIDRDVVKDSIRNYIATNSGVTNWTSIYPDLYAESEFIIIPFWSEIATVDNGYDEGLYRSAVAKYRMEEIENKQIPASYNTVTDFAAYKRQYLVTCSTNYRSILFYALGNPNNSGGKFSLLHLYPDYMDIPTTSPDFNRLSTKTQGFAIKLNEALHVAREYSRTKPIPTGYALSTKSNREYIGFDYDGFTFYILTLAGFMKAA